MSLLQSHMDIFKGLQQAEKRALEEAEGWLKSKRELAETREKLAKAEKYIQQLKTKTPPVFGATVTTGGEFVNFGMHSGKPFKEVPESYLKWCCKQDTNEYTNPRFCRLVEWYKQQCEKPSEITMLKQELAEMTTERNVWRRQVKDLVEGNDDRYMFKGASIAGMRAF